MTGSGSVMNRQQYLDWVSATPRRHERHGLRVRRYGDSAVIVGGLTNHLSEPGGGTDVIARPIALKMGDRLGQSIIYENRGGGGGVVAGEIVARAAPDGYTLLVAAVAVMTVTISLQKIPFDPVKDFAPITKFASTRATSLRSSGRYTALCSSVPMKESH